MAADALKSDKDAHVVAEVLRQKSKKSPKVYVVFIGKQPGVYTSWYAHPPVAVRILLTFAWRDNCEEQITGVASVHQGYSSGSDAAKAYRFAVQQGMVSRTVAGRAFDTRVAPRASVDFLTAPESKFDNALNVGITRKRWYNVYQGRVPGIYRTYLECSLSVVSVSNAVHDSFFTLQEARDAYTEADNEGRVFVRM